MLCQVFRQSVVECGAEEKRKKYNKMWPQIINFKIVQL